MANCPYISTRKQGLNRIIKIFNSLQVIVSFRQIAFPWQRKIYGHIPQNHNSFLRLPVRRYISCKIKRFWLDGTVQKELLKTKKFYSHNSQLYCATMTIRIFEIWYMYITPCFHMIIMFPWYKVKHETMRVSEIQEWGILSEARATISTITWEPRDWRNTNASYAS